MKVFKTLAIGLIAITSIAFSSAAEASTPTHTEPAYCSDYIKPTEDDYSIISGPYTRVHPGIDMVVPLSSDIYASADGVVEKVIPVKRSLLNHRPAKVIIKHSNGYRSIYSQLTRIDVTEGQPVHRGDKIALSGGVGIGSYRSSGPHLHFGITHKRTHVDPTCIVQ